MAKTALLYPGEQYGYPAWRAIDGDLSTDARSTGTAPYDWYLEIDLGEPKTVSKIDLTMGCWSGHNTSLKITYLDGEAWKDYAAFEESDFPYMEHPTRTFWKTVTTQKIRVQGTLDNQTYNSAIYEVKEYEAEPPPPPPPPMDIINVKKKIREVLLADASVSAVVGNRVYVGWLERDYTIPCITITDISEEGAVGTLGGERDEYNSIIQVDVWCKGDAKSGPLNRDELATSVRYVLGKKANFQTLQSYGFILGSPSMRPLDETDLEAPIFRKSLRFPVWYQTESYV